MRWKIRSVEPRRNTDEKNEFCLVRVLSAAQFFGAKGDNVDNDLVLMGVAFLLVTSVAVGVGLLLSGKGSKLDARIGEMTGKARPEEKAETVAQMARVALPKMGQIIVPDDEAERTKLQARLVHAGLYHRQAMHLFLGVKLVLLVLAVIVGIGLTTTKIIPLGKGLPIALVLFLAGMIGPSFWLDKRKAKRQSALRQGLPDALDVLIICLEGGLGMQGGIKRVADELSAAHPALGGELKIVDREIQLGRSPGEALNHFARRSDLEEALSLSSVVTQSERFGASLVKSMRTHSEALRIKRKQKAEEKAQKASTMILAPPLLFIFPAVFMVLLAPAVYEIIKSPFFAESAKP